MGTPYIGEIRMFGGNFAPAGWAFCDGQLLPIADNDALFTLIGTTYGGDGLTTFALPDLRGRIPVHQGTGPGLSTRVIGESGGVENVTLTLNQLPVHSHAPRATTNPGGAGPSGAIWAKAANEVYDDETLSDLVPMLNTLVQVTGGGRPHDNMAPFLAVSFIISLYGIFPSQS